MTKLNGNHSNHPDVGNNISPIGDNTFPKFDIINILEMKSPHIIVHQIDDNVEVEDTYVFKLLLRYFNKAYGINLSISELLYSRSSFNAFMNFVMVCILKRYVVINIECENQFMYAIENLRSKYLQNLRSIDKYYDEIVRTIYRPRGLSKKDEEVRNKMYLLDQAYSLVKLAFKDEKRESGERYFEHLKGVMEIILRELPNPNLDKILIALLHDVEEDLPEYADVIRKIYGNYIADGVNILSKKDWELYITQEELKNCGEYLEKRNTLLKEVRESAKKINPEISFTAVKKIKEKDLEKYMTKRQVDEYKLLKDKLEPFESVAKERRNEDYFGHLDDLCDDYLDVKFADRIHNLRDVSGVTKEKAIRKVKETEKYFLEVAKRRNPTAYNLMMIEIQKTKEKFGF